VSYPRKNSSEDSRHWIGLLQYNTSMHHSQSRQSTMLFHQSSELGSPPSPLPQGVPPLWFTGEGHTPNKERGRGGPNADEGTDIVVCILCDSTAWCLAEMAGIYPNISHYMWHDSSRMQSFRHFFDPKITRLRVVLLRYLRFPQCGAFS
jgi:hypothetical protein